MTHKTHKWRTSASLIIATPTSSSEENYNVLMLKRSDATAMLPNHTVFPGGLLDPEGDENVEWLKYFEEFGVPEQALRRLVLTSTDRPSILAPQGTGCYDRFFKRSKIWAREITLRLTALRECFEEVGILLCRTREQLDELTAEAPSAHFQDQNFDREAWQKRVHERPSEFLNLCQELKIVPDLWALHEWSVWASPTIIKKGYETVFYITFVDTQPSIIVEPSEVKECLWFTPIHLLRLYQHAELWFLPPQLYELSRLLGIQAYERLQTFAVERSKLGSTLLLPVAYACENGMVYVLPGDDFYVPEPHLADDLIRFTGTTEEMHLRSNRLHRYVFDSPAHFILNFPNLNGHLSPLKLPTEPQHKL